MIFLLLLLCVLILLHKKEFFTNYIDYAAKNAVQSKNTGGGGYYQTERRDINLRLAALSDINFNNKKILDIGSNSGEFLHLLSDKIEWGVGVDFDNIRVNESNILAKNKKNINFYTFDLKNEPFEILNLMCPEKPDIVFLFAVCQQWIYPCSNLINYIKNNSKMLCIEINGTKERKNELIQELKNNYDNVVEKTDYNCKDCWAGGKNLRRLFYAYNNDIPSFFLNERENFTNLKADGRSVEYLTRDDNNNYIKKFKDINGYNAEKNSYLRLQSSKHFPNLISWDDNQLILTMEDAGSSIQKNQSIPNWKEQIQAINYDLKNNNIKHNDIHIDNILQKDGNLSLIDFEWAEDMQTPPNWTKLKIGQPPKRACKEFPLIKNETTFNEYVKYNDCL